MRCQAVLAMVFMLTASAAAQVIMPPPTGQTLFSNPGSQANTATSALVFGSDITAAGGSVVQPFTTLLDVNSPSITASAVYDPAVGQAFMNVQAEIRALPESPLTIAVSATAGLFPGSIFGPWLPSNVLVPGVGLVHIDNPAVPLIDSLGIFGGPPSPVITDANGRLPFWGSLPMNAPEHVCIQAVVIDPAAPLGLRLTAAFALAKYQ